MTFFNRLYTFFLASLVSSPFWAHAVVQGATGLAIDSLIVLATAFLVNSFIPFMALVLIIWFAWRAIAGHRFGDFAVRFVVALTALALGLPGISKFFGGTIVTSFIL